MTEPTPAEARSDATARLLRARLGADGAWIDVDGTSMLPTIRPPARVRVEAASGPRPGEVWAFTDDAGEILAHRFVRHVGEMLRFKGDGNARPDPLVPPSRVVGRVVEAVDRRGARRVRRSRWRAWREAARYGWRRRRR